MRCNASTASTSSSNEAIFRSSRRGHRRATTAIRVEPDRVQPGGFCTGDVDRVRIAEHHDLARRTAQPVERMAKHRRIGLRRTSHLRGQHDVELDVESAESGRRLDSLRGDVHRVAEDSQSEVCRQPPQRRRTPGGLRPAHHRRARRACHPSRTGRHGSSTHGPVLESSRTATLQNISSVLSERRWTPSPSPSPTGRGNCRPPGQPRGTSL